MNLSTVIKPWWYDESKCSATLVIDGHVTTHDCMHNHKTVAAAQKCEAKVVEAAQKFIDHPDFVDKILGETDPKLGVLHEWEIPGDRPGILAIRMRLWIEE